MSDTPNTNTPAAQQTPAQQPNATPPAGQTPAEQTPQTPPNEGAQGGQQTPPAAPVVPEKYDLKIPDNSGLQPAHLEKIASFAKEQGFTNEVAQKLVDRDSELIATHQKSEVDAYNAKIDGWKQEIQNDPVLGGTNFTTTVETAHRALEKFGSPQLKEQLDASGLGNHPEMVRLFFNIGKAMKADTLVGGGHSGQPKSTADILYGGSN